MPVGQRRIGRGEKSRTEDKDKEAKKDKKHKTVLKYVNGYQHPKMSHTARMASPRAYRIDVLHEQVDFAQLYGHANRFQGCAQSIAIVKPLVLLELSR